MKEFSVNAVHENGNVRNFGVVADSKEEAFLIIRHDIGVPLDVELHLDTVYELGGWRGRLRDIGGEV